VLEEMPSHGRTIFEKFEDYASDVDVVFVLITPDDIGYPSGKTSSFRERARQNVIFECGYFLGSLRRRGGRVLLLQKGDCEMPSDLDGIVYVNITDGIEAVDKKIRSELSGWLPEFSRGTSGAERAP
jgi:predicted nucleotide-binding protein